MGPPNSTHSTSQQRKRYVLKKSHYSAEMLNLLNYFRPRSPFSSPQNIQHTKYSTYLFKNHMLFEHGATKFNIFSISPERNSLSETFVYAHFFSVGFSFPTPALPFPMFHNREGWGGEGVGDSRCWRVGGKEVGVMWGFRMTVCIASTWNPKPQSPNLKVRGRGKLYSISLSLCLYVFFFFSLHSLICFHLMPVSISSGSNATLLWEMTALRRQSARLWQAWRSWSLLSWQDLQQEEHATDRMNGGPGAMLEDGVLINPHGNQSQPMSNQNLVMTKRSRRPEQRRGSHRKRRKVMRQWEPHASHGSQSCMLEAKLHHQLLQDHHLIQCRGLNQQQGGRGGNQLSPMEARRMRWVVQQSMTGITLSGQINLGSDSGIVVWPRYDRWRPQRLDCRTAKAPWWSQSSTTRESKGADHIWSEICRQPEHVVLYREHLYLSGGPIALSFLWVNGLARSNWRSALFAQLQCYDEQQCCNGCFSIETQKDEGECWYVADHSSPSHLNPPCSSEEETMCKNVVRTHAFCVAQATNAPSVQHRR